MKYVNHMTCAFQDEKVQAAFSEGGHRVYSIYWILVETIAAQIRPESVSVKLTLTWRQWGSKLLSDQRSVRSATQVLHNSSLIVLMDHGKSATIEIPNILKYCDEYSRKVGIKSGHSPAKTPDKLRSVSGFPALPALPDIKDLTATPSAEGSEALAGAPTTSTPPRTKGSCYVVGCQNPQMVKTDGKWYCRTCNPEYSR